MSKTRKRLWIIAGFPVLLATGAFVDQWILRRVAEESMSRYQSLSGTRRRVLEARWIAWNQFEMETLTSYPKDDETRWLLVKKIDGRWTAFDL